MSLHTLLPVSYQAATIFLPCRCNTVEASISIIAKVGVTQGRWWHGMDTDPYHPWDWGYIYLHENHKYQPNVGKYTIHGFYGGWRWLRFQLCAHVDVEAKIRSLTMPEDRGCKMMEAIELVFQSSSIRYMTHVHNQHSQWFSRVLICTNVLDKPIKRVYWVALLLAPICSTNFLGLPWKWRHLDGFGYYIILIWVWQYICFFHNQTHLFFA